MRASQRQIHFVTGKGGVGKSLVSVALARRFVDAGEKTLLVQVAARDSHGPLLQLAEAVPDDLKAVERGLTVVNLNPAQATREYALMTLKLESVYRAVFENRVTKTFLRFVPSLNELTMMGKLWFHAEEKDGLFSQAPRFRRIVVDCPSTGHALKLFAVSRVLTDMVRVGPMVEKTRAMSEVWRDPLRTAVHVVTLPEELPVNETGELVARLQKDGTAPIGHVIVNQMLPRLFPDKDVVDRVPDGPVKAVALRRLQREARERAQRERVDALGLPIIDVPHLQESPLTPAHIARVAALLGGIS